MSDRRPDETRDLEPAGELSAKGGVDRRKVLKIGMISVTSLAAGVYQRPAVAVTCGGGLSPGVFSWAPAPFWPGTIATDCGDSQYNFQGQIDAATAGTSISINSINITGLLVSGPDLGQPTITNEGPLVGTVDDGCTFNAKGTILYSDVANPNPVPMQGATIVGTILPDGNLANMTLGGSGNGFCPPNVVSAIAPAVH